MNIQEPESIRVATFNAALNRSSEGKLIEDLSTGEQQQPKNVAEIIQRVAPEVLLINEFDYNSPQPVIAPNLFLSNYLEEEQFPGVDPITYEYFYVAPSNTGVASGFDLNRDGKIVTEPETEGYANDAWGFGDFEGQYGMVFYSQHEILWSEIRTFRNFLWKDMPGARLPDDPSTPELGDWYSPEILEEFPLSSKSHWDIPILVDGEVIHILASHPTPPVFDGAEDRNGLRNSDEIRFWSDYVTPGEGDYIYDDAGNRGGLEPGSKFMILGDQNADPFDGDSTPPAINQLLDNPFIQGSSTDASITPFSAGGVDATIRQGGANLDHVGNPAYDTGDFNDSNPGNLRVDYVLPSLDLEIEDKGIYWLTEDDPNFERLIGDFNPNLDPEEFPEGFLSSDHRLVYLDVTPGEANIEREQNRNSVTKVESLGVVTFPTGFQFGDPEVGGLSGITYSANDETYYSISDDRGNRADGEPARFYTVDIDLSDGSLDEGDVSFQDVTTLLDSEGQPFASNSLDPEGIALTLKNTLYISSEGDANNLVAPFVNQFGLDGQEIDSLTIPEKFLPTAEDFGIRNNLAFESTTITPDGRFLYTAVEEALKQDGTGATVDDSSYSRIVKYDLTTGEVVGEYVYEVEPIPNAPIPDTASANNGLVELLAVDNNGTLLALERSFASGVGNTIKLFQAQTQGALDVSTFDDLLLDEDTRYDIDPFVSKELLIDFKADLDITPDNLEGMTLGETLPDGRQSLILVSDNNFSENQTTQFIALALDIETTPAVLPVVETPYTIDQAEGEAELFGDSDDLAVWIEPENPDNSIVIGTLKDGGLAVFSLEGEILQTITAEDILGEGAEFGDIRYNNVDLIYNFDVFSRGGSFEVDLAIASDRENDSLAIFAINPQTKQLTKFATPELDAPDFSIFGVDDGEATAYGLANYVSPVDGSTYVFVTQADGNQIAQLRLTTDSPADIPLIDAEVVRTITLPVEEGKEPEDYQSEGIVVDQEQGTVYLGVEEELGIVKFDAEPDGGDEITLVRPLDSPELTPDLEGLALYYAGEGKGYLIASSQGDSSYAVYTREANHDYLGSFVVGDNHKLGIDQANETDGLEVINVPLGSNFPLGGFFVQDGANEPQNALENADEIENNSTNFKFLPWDEVANAFATPLIIDPESYNPRQIKPPIATIYEIQGNGPRSWLENQIVTTTGIVTADFRSLQTENFAPLRGIFLQDAVGDGDITTSDGIFVFLPTVNDFADFDLEIGDEIEVTATVKEDSSGGSNTDGRTDFTHLDFVTDIKVKGSDEIITPTTVTLPETVEGELEQYEGMLVEFAPLTVSQNFFLGRYGQLSLSSANDAGEDGRLVQPTNVFLPDSPEREALTDENLRRFLVLDDAQDSRKLGDNPVTVPYLGGPEEGKIIRAGDTVSNLVGVLDYGRINSSSSAPSLDYRLQPLDIDAPIFTNTNTRTETPDDVGGSLKVASFNVLNYFTTLGSRGASTPEEFQRQRTKIIEAIVKIDADIVGLIEIENNGYDADSAIQDLVHGINEQLGGEVYAFVDPGTERLGTDEITNGYIYKIGEVTTVGDTAVLDKTVDERFDTDNQRPALAQTFQEIASGEILTVINNHFKSKGSPPRNLPPGEEPDPRDLDRGDGQGFSNFTRTQAAEALVDWLATDPTGSGDSDFLIIGDLNAYAKEDPIETIKSAGYTDLLNEYVGDEAYSFVFDGQSGYLDHGLASESLASQVTGTTEWHINADEPKILDYETSFNGEPYYSPDPYRASDHDPLIVGLNLEQSPEPFTLQILHASDQEAGVPAFQDIPGLSAVMKALDGQYGNSLKLTSGDLYIAGPFFDGSREIYDSVAQQEPANKPGIADILIQNELGWDVASVGNHEFDAGDSTFFELLAPNADLVNGDNGGKGIGPEGYLGAAFPYLANNLDYSGVTLPDGLNELPNGGAPQANSLTGSVVADVNGEAVGIIGIVTPYLKSIANIGNLGVTTQNLETGEAITPTTPIDIQVDSIIANIKPEIESLTETKGVNKLILMTHLQESAIEQALAEELAQQQLGIDILIGGGSHQVMANGAGIPPLRGDETQQNNGQLLQPYPQEFGEGDSKVYYVNTGANYRYLSQLVVDFDENGIITRVGDDSGTFATDIAGVDRLYQGDIQNIDDVKAVADPEVVAIVEGVETYVNALDGNIFGQTEFFLNGTRGDVRTQETNLGNLAADAQTYYAQKYLEAYGDDLLADFDQISISFKNGGGIRDNIGVSFIEGGTNELVQLPPQPNPEVGKEEGDVSELDISNSLRFNNDLTVGTITAEGLLETAEHMVSAVESTSGRFGQISGFKFSYDPDAPSGDRLSSLALADEANNTVETIVENGELVVAPSRTFAVVTLGFLAAESSDSGTGGDGYPNVIENQVQLSEFDEPDSLGRADLVSGSEQDALAEYFAAFFNQDNAQNPYAQEDTPPSEDERIQNLNFREDTVIPTTPTISEIVSPTDWDYIQKDSNVLITAFGQDVAQLNNLSLDYF